MTYYHARSDGKLPGESGYVCMCVADPDRIRHYGTVYAMPVPADAITVQTAQRLVREHIAAHGTDTMPGWVSDDMIDGLIDDMDPTDIVESAGSWDSGDFVHWYVDNIGCEAVILSDGLVIFNING